LQGDLLSLLGFGALELIATVLPARVRVKDDLERLLAAAEHADADGSSSGGLGGSGGAGGGPAAPDTAPVGCMVKLTTKSKLGKSQEERRTDATKLAQEKRRAALDETRSPDEIAAELEWLSAAGFEPATKRLRQEEAAKAAKPLAPDSALGQLRSLASSSGLGKALPEGTVQRTGKGWEEVPVPPAPTTRLEPRPVQMSELPEHALQSAVVGVALDSNEKMLVGAPTGARKTNLALLAIEQYSVAVALSTTLSDAEEALATASVQVSSVSLPAL
jgi:hypothetical protein